LLGTDNEQVSAIILNHGCANDRLKLHDIPAPIGTRDSVL